MRQLKQKNFNKICYSIVIHHYDYEKRHIVLKLQDYFCFTKKIWILQNALSICFRLVGMNFNETTPTKPVYSFSIPVSHYFAIDSFPLPVHKSERAHYCCSLRKGGANYGKCPSKKRTYFGFRIHALILRYDPPATLVKSSNWSSENLYFQNLKGTLQPFIKLCSF